jgi:hypothetical protein
MSLWLESLTGWGGGVVNPEASQHDQEEAACHILRHLAMTVPRAWWEKALIDGINPRQDHILILKALKKEIEKLPELAGIISYPAFVALPFTYPHDHPEGDFKLEVLKNSTLENIISQTSSILQTRPELQQLGKRIAQIADEID